MPDTPWRDAFDVASIRQMLATIPTSTLTPGERAEVLVTFDLVARILLAITLHRDRFVARMGEPDLAETEAELEDTLVAAFAVLSPEPDDPTP